MITPNAVVGDVHAELALAQGFDQRAVHVDAGQVEERRRLPSPDPLANAVENVDQGMHVGGAEATTEIAGGRRIGDAQSPERVEVDFILTTQFEVLQTGAVAQRVVGQVEHMVRLVVGHVNLEQVQVLVDGIDEADPLGEQMKSADAAVGDAAAAVGDVIVDVGRGEGGPADVAEPFLVETAFDSALAVAQLLVYLGVHSKSLSVGGDGCSLQHQTPQNSQGISSFSKNTRANDHWLRLFKDQSLQTNR